MNHLKTKLTSPLAMALAGCACLATSFWLDIHPGIPIPFALGAYLLAVICLVIALVGILDKDPEEEPYPPCRTFVTVYEHQSDSVWLRMEIADEIDNGLGHYRFFRPDGVIVQLDLSENKWTIIRHKVYEDECI